MKKRALIIVPIILALIAVMWVTVFRKKDNGNHLLLSGNIEITSAELGFRVPGTLLERLVNEGEAVTEGQILAKLDPVDQQFAVSKAEANLHYAEFVLDALLAGSRPQEINQAGAMVSQARARLDEIEAGSRTQEIAEAQASLERAQAGLDAAQSQYGLARADFDRYTELYTQGVITQREYEATQTQFEVAESSVSQAEALVQSANEALSLRMEGARPEQIEQARANLQQASAAYDLVLQGPRPETIDQARAQVDIANETLNQAKQALQYTELTAPFAGVVMSKSAEPGEYLNPGSPVVSVGRLDEVWLRAYINETDLSRITLGQTVEVRTDTYPDRVYQGTISFISSEAEFTPKMVQTVEERVKLMYMVKILLSNPNQELKPGMPGDATIILQ